MRKALTGTLAVLMSVSLSAGEVTKGEALFLKLCWGCHHQTAEAFGPSFASIAGKRSDSEIQGQIVRPDLLYKELGYTRNAMPPFPLTGEELQDITAYIKSFK
ncbi:MAG: cytochrome c [Sulfuricurvum sp.]|nr:cytochrome c [Sulfuricurvum sp.]